MSSSYHEHERLYVGMFFGGDYAFLSRKFPDQLLNLERKGHISENIYHEIRQTASLDLTSP